MVGLEPTKKILQTFCRTREHHRLTEMAGGIEPLVKSFADSPSTTPVETLPSNRKTPQEPELLAGFEAQGFLSPYPSVRSSPLLVSDKQ